jgi:hypothetical protein
METDGVVLVEGSIADCPARNGRKVASVDMELLCKEAVMT